MGTTTKININTQKVAEILKFIDDKDTFIVELIQAINKANKEDNIKYVDMCLDEWEASAELNSIPGLSGRVWKRFNSLVEAGLINEQ